jgi:hypothetical protein
MLMTIFNDSAIVYCFHDERQIDPPAFPESWKVTYPSPISSFGKFLPLGVHDNFE